VDIDGARVLFEHGWGLVRASNTQPVLVLRFEAETADDLKRYQSEVERAVKEAR
jgi:phosphomannomutase/phosphoglucomutase